jgi:GTP:adenosylcobinamide-phosphate guanylyltransferase
VKVDVVVLAGGDGAVIDPSCRFKGLVMVSGRPMVEWVVDGVRQAELVEDVAVVVPTAEDLGPWVDKVDKIVVSDGRFSDNVLAGIRAFKVDRPVLVVTGDIPAVDGEALDDFLSRSLATGADFVYPVIPKEDIQTQFPGGERTYVRLKEGKVTGGNMMLLNPALVERNVRIGQGLFDARKSPLGMVRLLGAPFIARFMLGTLDVPMLEQKMTELLGGSGRAIFTQHASIGMDVDKPSDLRIVEELLGPESAGIPPGASKS